MTLIAIGGKLVTCDGELLPGSAERYVPLGSRSPEWRIPGAWLEEWKEFGYLELDDRGRSTVLDSLLGRPVVLEPQAMRDVCLAEYNRLVREMRKPWYSWEMVVRHARDLEKVTQGQLGVAEQYLDEIVQTYNAIAKSRHMATRGELGEVDAMCFAELEAGDGRLYRQEVMRVGGLYSGGWALRQLSPHQWRHALKYWDSRWVTRYVVAEGRRPWKLITLGELIRDAASDLIGRECDRDEFELWLEAR